jgi:hypothetical protein
MGEQVSLSGCHSGGLVFAPWEGLAAPALRPGTAAAAPEGEQR